MKRAGTRNIFFLLGLSEGLSRTVRAFVCDLSVLRRKKSIECLCSWKRRYRTDAEESHRLIEK